MSISAIAGSIIAASAAAAAAVGLLLKKTFETFYNMSQEYGKRQPHWEAEADAEEVILVYSDFQKCKETLQPILEELEEAGISIVIGELEGLAKDLEPYSPALAAKTREKEEDIKEKCKGSLYCYMEKIFAPDSPFVKSELERNSGASMEDKINNLIFACIQKVAKHFVAQVDRMLNEFHLGLKYRIQADSELKKKEIENIDKLLSEEFEKVVKAKIESTERYGKLKRDTQYTEEVQSCMQVLLMEEN